MADALADADLAGGDVRLLRRQPARPATGPGLAQPRRTIDGDQPLTYGEATEALEELAELDALTDQLGQDYPGASLDDVDVEAIERQLGAGGDRRRPGSARARARAAPAGLAGPRQRRAPADPESVAAAWARPPCDGSSPAVGPRPGRPRGPRRGAGRRADRRLARVVVRRRAAARRRPHGVERRAAAGLGRPRRARPGQRADARPGGLRGRRDRAAVVGCGRRSASTCRSRCTPRAGGGR